MVTYDEIMKLSDYELEKCIAEIIGTPIITRPYRSEDLFLAWELAETLLRDGWTVELFAPEPGEYHCVLGKQKGKKPNYLPDIEGKTPGQAIARAIVYAKSIKLTNLTMGNAYKTRGTKGETT